MNLTDKIKLLYHPEKWSNLHTAFLESLWDQHFDRVPIDNNKQYDPQTHVVLTHVIDTKWTQEWINKGFKVIIDNTWESHSALTIPESSQVKHLVHYTWHRTLEPLWNESLGYTSYVKNNNCTNTFLMLMNLRKPHRSAIYEKLTPLLGDAIYSYNGIGVGLQNASDINVACNEWQRYVDYEWFNKTAFSVVVETHVNLNETNNLPWISEKGYKPIAFEHPFVAWAPVGYLKMLKSQGFMTFDHLIDESYDNEIDNNMRLNKVCKIIEDLTSQVKKQPLYFSDSETVRRLVHNRKLFYNSNIIAKDFEENIINKIKGFANE